MEFQEQVKRAERKAATQQLRGEAVQPFDIDINSLDYRLEYIKIKAQAQKDTQVFGTDFKKGGDSGLRTIQLAVVLACDLLLKLNDQPKFIEIIEKVGQMIESHAEAALWLIKWLTSNYSVV